MADASVAREREALVDETISTVVAIEREEGVTSGSLEKMKAALGALAARPELFPPDEYPDGDEASVMRTVHQTPDGRYALYFCSDPPGTASPPHDHATWAIIAGMAGTEENRIYERPTGAGPLRLLRTIPVVNGVTLSLAPDAVHSIHVSSEIPTRTFHFYGRGMEHMSGRVQFDLQTGSASGYDGAAYIEESETR